MGAYVFDSQLDQFGTEAMRRIFSDENVVQEWLDVEAALAKVEAELGEQAATEIRRNGAAGRARIHLAAVQHDGCHGQENELRAGRSDGAFRQYAPQP